MELWQRAYCKVGERFADIIWRAFSREFSRMHLVMDLHAPNKEPRPYPSFNADYREPLNRSSALVQPLLLRHWLDDVIFTKILDCRSGSDEVRPGVLRRNLNIPLFVLHITMNKSCTPAPRGKQIRSHASLSSFLICLIVATMLNV